MDMEEIFQELILSVGLSMAICYMIMKFQSHGDEEKVETCMASIDGSDKEALHEQKREEQSLVHDVGKSKRTRAFADFLEKVSVENIHENYAICGSEITCEVVEDAVVLQDLNKEEESVGAAKPNCFDHDNSYFIDDDELISEIVEDGIKQKAVNESSKRLNVCEIEVISAQPVEEILERSIFRKIESELSEDVEVREANCDAVSEILSEDGKEKERVVLKKDDHGGEEAEEEEGLFDDWEGIERTELEKLFGAAVSFVGSKSNAGLIDRDLKIQLYGLHKIAIEGPCQGPQPMALKVSARAKWNSWRRLGNMNRELAMEQYLTHLSKSIPGWMIDETLVKPRVTPSC